MSGPDDGGSRRLPGAYLAAAALGVSLLLAGVLHRFASSSPDGLERTAQQQGFAGTGDHLGPHTPFAGYAGPWAALVGLGAVMLLGLALTWWLRRGRAGDRTDG